MHHSISHYIHVLIDTYGLLVVAGCIGLESIGIPLPGETALIIGSVIAGRTHELNIVEVIVTATCASFVGRIFGYMIGAKFGYWLLLRYGSYIRITQTRVKLGQYLFLQHGAMIMIIAQFVPVMRAIAGILAGANRMPWRHYLFACFVGALVWSIFFGLAAFTFGLQFKHLADSWWFLSGPSGWVVFGIVAVIVIIAFANFVGHHEAQLTAKAERALPGPLELP
jgi:membrane protein DedA with SNARE-associated domain